MKNKVLQFLQHEIDLASIPGAVIHVSYNGDTILQEAIGNRVVYPSEAPMQIDTVFDLASLTKVVATLPIVLKLMDDGMLRLDDQITNFLPQFGKNNKEGMRLRHLLTHTSGFTAHLPFYAESLTTEQIIERICEENLEYEIGTKVNYSDLNFILLYKIVEIVSKKPFATYLKEEVFEPLSMQNTSFNPTLPQNRYAATEYSDALQDYKSGIVHDENAEAMGGMSGHAGLFSTIKDLANFAKMVENDGFFNGRRILSKSAIALSQHNFTAFDEEFRGIGWMVKSETRASCGDFFSPRSYGHTGFTGTSIWFDPDIKLHVILLTNRVHYGRKDDIIRIRPRLHNLIRAYF